MINPAQKSVPDFFLSDFFVKLSCCKPDGEYNGYPDCKINSNENSRKNKYDIDVKGNPAVYKVADYVDKIQH